MADVGIGLVGAGRIAQTAHLPALAKADGARLVALCDASEVLSRAVAERYGVRGYLSIDELLGDDAVEAVILAVPDRLHPSLGSQVMRAGRHVLVEKPLAATVTDAEALAAVAEETGMRLQVGTMKRHDPGVRYAAEAVRTRIGRVLSASLWYRVHAGLRTQMEATYAPPLVVDEGVRELEASLKADRSAYLLATHGAHVFDVLRYLLGDPRAVSARHARAGEDATWHGMAELAGGGLAHFEITAAVHAEWSEGADVYGEDGHVRLRTHFPFALRASDVEVYEERAATATRPVFGDSDPYEHQIEAFARSIRGGTAVTPDAADGVAAVRLIAAVADSVADEGRRVPL